MKYNVLVIEDNAGDFALIEEFLIEKFRSVVISHAVSLKEARSICQDKTDFDVILLDLSLPDRAGVQLINDVTGMCMNAPIIVLTGYADFDFGVHSLALGISDYILKEELTSINLYKSIIYSAERKKNVIALADSERQYSDLFHLSPLPMWVVNLDTLRFLDVNTATINMYGYTREEFLLMTLRDIRPVEEISEMEKGIEAARRPGGQPPNVMIHKMKDGTLKYVEIKRAPFHFNGVSATCVIANDITEKLNHLKAIEEQNEKLRDIGWLQSHVIRSPLARIMGLVQLIKDFEADGTELREILGYISCSADELDQVIKDISSKTNAVIV